MGRKAEERLIYIGWIYGNRGDKQILTALGVRGHMIWKPSDNRGSLTPGASGKKGIFEHCECTEEILDKLEERYPVFFRGSFSFTDEKAYQKYLYQNGWLLERCDRCGGKVPMDAIKCPHCGAPPPIFS